MRISSGFPCHPFLLSLFFFHLFGTSSRILIVFNSFFPNTPRFVNESNALSQVINCDYILKFYSTQKITRITYSDMSKKALLLFSSINDGTKIHCDCKYFNLKQLTVIWKSQVYYSLFTKNPNLYHGSTWGDTFLLHFEGKGFFFFYFHISKFN